MNKISCDMCMDLLPLVQDGVASEDSSKAVEEHIKSCPRCRALYKDRPPIEIHNSRVAAKIKNKLHTFFALLTFLGMFFGVSLIINQNPLYIVFIMPVIGCCGYVVYHWKALWKIPVILTILFLLAYAILLLQGNVLDLLGILFLIALITVFADTGVLIAGFIHFAFRKEK